VDSEHGRLLDVLVCRPDNFRWLTTSAITRATLEAGYTYDPELAAGQHANMVSAYEEAGVRCHYLELDSARPARNA
jgi:N-dimethylarginine dimethylaminohydrolase